MGEQTLFGEILYFLEVCNKYMVAIDLYSAGYATPGITLPPHIVQCQKLHEDLLFLEDIGNPVFCLKADWSDNKLFATIPNFYEN